MKKFKRNYDLKNILPRFSEKILFKLILTPINVKANYKYTKLYFIAKSKRLMDSQSDSDDSLIFNIILNVRVIIEIGMIETIMPDSNNVVYTF